MPIQWLKIENILLQVLYKRLNTTKPSKNGGMREMYVTFINIRSRLQFLTQPFKADVIKTQIQFILLHVMHFLKSQHSDFI